MRTDVVPAAPCARCGHVRDAHEHYRRGSDCALCECGAFTDRRAAGYVRESGRVARALWAAGGRWRRSRSNRRDA